MAAGISPGEILAQAQARIPSLVAAQAQPERDAEALDRLARWMHRYTPLVTIDSPDGIWLDTTGCDHIHGGERALLADVLGRLRKAGYAARAAVADTPGCAHAVARHGAEAMTVVQTGSDALLRALTDLPVEALRLSAETRDAARRIGFDRIGDVVSQIKRTRIGPNSGATDGGGTGGIGTGGIGTGGVGTGGVGRGPVAHRVGAGLFTRLDQALGRSFEPLAPQFIGACISHRMDFAEPLSGRDGLEAAVHVLVVRACGDLERAGEGALGVDLLFEAMDQSCQAIRIGTSHPTRTQSHLARMLVDGLERVEAERGIETMRLIVSSTATLKDSQLTIGSDEPSRVMISELVDRLTTRSIVVWRASVNPSRPPETSVVATGAMVSPRSKRRQECNDATAVKTPPRPSRLLDPPQPVNVTGLLPDFPPVQFVWRRQRHKISRADGPERFYCRRAHSKAAMTTTDGGKSEHCDAGVWAVRDYFAVEDDTGKRFWLMREGDGVHLDTGDLSWYLHGLF